ncbi:hypothetical protein HCU64_06125 [Methylobacterium sp. C25]|nr:hypothetical protein [Methylobacterium sp. C25]
MAKFVEFFVGKVLDADVAVLGRASADQLVELGLSGGTVAILEFCDDLRAALLGKTGEGNFSRV